MKEKGCKREIEEDRGRQKDIRNQREGVKMQINKKRGRERERQRERESKRERERERERKRK